MAEPAAETAYVFRHALLREAAYQLQPPAERARLHELALAAIPALFEAAGPSALDQHAADLADHASAAALARRDITGNLARLRELAASEAHWLQRAARHAEATYDLAKATVMWDRLSQIPHLDALLHATALVEATVIRRGSGHAREVPAIGARALQAAQLVGSTVLQARALQAMALATYDIASPVEAEQLCRKALDLAQQAGDAQLALNLRSNLAVMLAVQRRFEEARALYLELLAETRAARRWDDHANVLANLANLDSHLGQYSRAEHLYRAALGLTRRHGRARDLAHLLDKLGVVCAYQQRHAEARRYCEQAVAWAGTSGDRLTYGKVLGNLASVLRDVGESVSGTRMLVQALEVNRECGNLSAIAACAINLAETLGDDDPQGASLLDEAESASSQMSAGNFLGVIACTRALRDAGRTGTDAAKAAWLKGLAMIRQARASWEEQSVVESMRAFCAARGMAPFDADEHGRHGQGQ